VTGANVIWRSPDLHVETGRNIRHYLSGDLQISALIVGFIVVGSCRYLEISRY
jgi:hypothetical protein